MFGLYKVSHVINVQGMNIQENDPVTRRRRPLQDAPDNCTEKYIHICTMYVYYIKYCSINFVDTWVSRYINFKTDNGVYHQPKEEHSNKFSHLFHSFFLACHTRAGQGFVTILAKGTISQKSWRTRVRQFYVRFSLYVTRLGFFLAPLVQIPTAVDSHSGLEVTKKLHIYVIRITISYKKTQYQQKCPTKGVLASYPPGRRSFFYIFLLQDFYIFRRQLTPHTLAGGSLTYKRGGDHALHAYCE